MAATTIEWTEFSANPIRFENFATGGIGHYCEKVSKGCSRCYAERLQVRFKNKISYNAKDRDKGRSFLDPKVLQKIEGRRKPTTYFLCDMTDMFGDWVRDEWIASIFETIDKCKQHTFQLLTKRPENVIAKWPGGVYRPNVQLGTSVEDQKATARIDELIKCRHLCAVLYLSCEPLLGTLDLSPWMEPIQELLTCKSCGEEFASGESNRGRSPCHLAEGDPNGSMGGSKIDWVIAGGESGPRARPTPPSAFQSLRDECFASGTPFFFKQHGEWVTEFHPAADTGMRTDDRFTTLTEDGKDYTGVMMVRVGNKKAGRLLDGKIHEAMPVSK